MSTQEGAGVMTPAGGDRFLGRGELGMLAGSHEEADKSSGPGNDHTKDLLSPQMGIVENVIRSSFQAENSAIKFSFF